MGLDLLLSFHDFLSPVSKLSSVSSDSMSVLQISIQNDTPLLSEAQIELWINAEYNDQSFLQ